MSPSKEKINYILSVLITRKIDNGNSIKFKNKYYQSYNKKLELQCFKPGTECLVIESFDGSLLATIDENVYVLKELNIHKKVSLELDQIIDEIPKEKKIYIPPMSHSWKATSFKKQIEKAHTNHVYA